MINEYKIKVDDTYCYVVKFGTGRKNLVILPGLSLCGLQGQASSIEQSYSLFEEEYTCFLIDYRNSINNEISFNILANDVLTVFKELNIVDPYLYGVSLGGMVSEYLCINYPKLVKKLVLCSSMCRCTNKMKATCENWLKYCSNNDVVGLNRNFINICYSEKYINTIKEFIPELVKKGNEDNIQKFKSIVKEIISINLKDQIKLINCPTYVIGDRKDNVIGVEGSLEIIDILKCNNYIYEEYSHAVYDEAPDIKQRIYDFLKE